MAEVGVVGVEPGGAGEWPVPSVISLARVLVDAFSRFDQRGAFGVWRLWVGVLVALLLYERRVHASGKAVCLLGVRRGRAALAAAAFVALAGVFGAVWPFAGFSFLVVALGAFAPLAWNAVRELPARIHLARATPAGRHVYLHSFASVRPGAGAELLQQVCSEADRGGLPIALDAEAHALVEYYRAFGFQECGRPVRFPGGQELQRMWRPARPRAVVAGCHRDVVVRQGGSRS